MLRVVEPVTTGTAVGTHDWVLDIKAAGLGARERKVVECGGDGQTPASASQGERGERGTNSDATDEPALLEQDALTNRALHVGLHQTDTNQGGIEHRFTPCS